MAGSSPPLQISAGIRAHIIEDTGTILVGTRDAHLIPEITRGWGPTILPDCHTIDLCISLSAGAKTLDNLRDQEEIAVTFHQTVSYKTVQLKGRFLESGDLTAQDWESFERQRNVLTEQAKAYRIPPNIGLRILPLDPVRIRFVVQQAFEQTPGPRAGSTL
ncbi:MAG: hypothetical protein WBX22_23125 [Silvibacterium sp.]